MLAAAAAGVAILSEAPHAAHAEETDDEILSLVCTGRGRTPEDAELMARLAALRKCAQTLLGERVFEDNESELSVRLFTRHDHFVAAAELLSSETTHTGASARLAVDVRIGLVRAAVEDLREKKVVAPSVAATPKRETLIRPAPLPPHANRLMKLNDGATRTKDLVISDATGLSIGKTASTIDFRLHMQRDLVDGMFTVIEMHYDCDANRNTGIDGYEYETRASVGSRFRPNAFLPRTGAPQPMSLARASDLRIVEHSQVGGRQWRAFTNFSSLSDPHLGTKELQWSVERSILRKFGARYADTGIRFRAVVMTTCAEHPLTFEYDALGKGLPIRVDGAVDEWSGGPYVEDPPNELHQLIQFLDVTAVWAEHDRSSVILRVDFAAPGFADPPSGGGDVRRRDRLVVRIQPVGEDYMEPTTVSVPAGRLSTVSNAAGRGASVEIAVPRDPRQTHFRIAVRSEAKRMDEIGDPYTNLFRLK